MPRYAHDLDPAPTEPPGSETTQGNAPAPTGTQPASPVAPDAESAAVSTPAAASDSPVYRTSDTVLLTLGRYELLEKVAVGGMGVIYRAHDTVLRRTVALKMIRSGVLAQPDEIERFYIEARAVAQLKHPNIIRIHDIAEHEGRHFFTMDFAPNGSVTRQRDLYAQEPRKTVELLHKVARAVHHAHQNQILHRDLKPSNILLDADLEPLVSDFGLAKIAGDVERTEEGQAVGTPAYMAPEQAAGRKDQIGPHTDVWAMGVVLYELLTAQRPFHAKTREEITRLILDSDPTPPRRLRSIVDRDLETIILKCLQKEPAERYPSAEALADDLKRWLNSEPPVARRISLTVRGLRRLRRAFVPIAAGVCVLLLALFSVEVVQSFTQGDGLSEAERKLKNRKDEIRQALRAGKEVVLVGSHGDEVLYPWKRPGDPFTLHERATEPLRIDTQTQVLFLLHPDPELPRYRLEAELQLLPAESPANVAGLFFGASDQPSRFGTESWSLLFTFAEHTPFQSLVQLDRRLAVEHHAGPPRRMVKLDRLRARPWAVPCLTLVTGAVGTAAPNPIGSAHALVTLASAGQLRVRTALPTPWRRLAIEVGPSEIQAHWQEALFTRIATAELQEMTKLRLHEWRQFDKLDLLPPPPFAMNARGALGLYLERGGKTLVRNVVLKPLPAE
jgi:tRNA A-37 threonylcarbamoyl transferase component Bud32